MITYLGVVQGLVDSSVYSRGVRLYLEGKVGLPQELDLEYWREYEVYDRITYTVVLPVLHLAMKREIIHPLNSHNVSQSIDLLDNQARIEKCLTRFAQCGCEYFAEMGLCKHVVAACASLEQEFGVKQERDNVSRDLEESFVVDQAGEATQILDRIFEVDINKKSRRWEHEFEAYLSQSGERVPQSLKHMIAAVNKDTILYKDLLNFIATYGREATNEYNKEKNLVRFALFTLHYSNPMWVEMWLELTQYMVQVHKRKIVLELWIIIKSGSGKDISELFQDYLKHQHQDEKSWYITELQTIYIKNKDIWLDFVFVSEAEDWLKNNYQNLDPLTLLRFAPLIPDQQEDIEITILNQLKQWSDFLQVGDYNEVTEVFQTWQRVLGRSSYFEEALAYYKATHGKKRKLIAGLVK